MESGKVKRTLVWATSSSMPSAVSTCEASSEPTAQAEPLERLGVTASSGSASADGSGEASPVLSALGIDEEVTHTSGRLTCPNSITNEHGRTAIARHRP